MSLRLRRKESVRAAIGRVARKRVGYSLELLNRKANAHTGDRIHEARKQLKQLRAILKLVGHEVGRKRCARADHCLSEVTRTLSKLRDTTVLMATLQSLHEHGGMTTESLATVRSTLEIHWKRTYTRVLATPGRRRLLTRALREARRRIEHWSSIHRGWKALGPGLNRVYRAGRIAAAAASTDESDEALHECRKRTKDLLYATEFLRPVRPGAMQAKIDTARRLADLLGDDHDLAVLGSALRGELHGQLRPAERVRATTTVARRRRSIQRTARALASGLYEESEDAFVGRIHQYWKEWRGHARIALRVTRQRQ
jgi:CHAD domain-containing protein